MNNSQAVSECAELHLFMSKHRHVRKVLIKSFPHSYPGRDLPSLQFCPSTSLRGLRRETVKKHVMNHFQSISSICISLHVVAFVHAPSLTRSNTSLASKLISSVSWPTYWYNARQRGPWGRGCGLGAGGGRWWMLIFLCFLWQRGEKGGAHDHNLFTSYLFTNMNQINF